MRIYLNLRFNIACLPPGEPHLNFPCPFPTMSANQRPVLVLQPSVNTTT